MIGAGMLRGLHDTRWPLIFALVGYWGIGLGIGSWLAFSRDWQGVGIWAGLASGLAAVALLMLGRWLLRERHRPDPACTRINKKRPRQPLTDERAHNHMRAHRWHSHGESANAMFNQLSKGAQGYGFQAAS